MDSGDQPRPESHGALVPPGRRPPTAIGAATPEPSPAPKPRPRPRGHTELTVQIGPDLGKLVTRLLEVIDRAAEIVAVELGLREPTK